MGASWQTMSATPGVDVSEPPVPIARLLEEHLEQSALVSQRSRQIPLADLLVHSVTSSGASSPWSGFGKTIVALASEDRWDIRGDSAVDPRAVGDPGNLSGCANRQSQACDTTTWV